MDITVPYYNKIQHTKILIESYHLNNNILANMLVAAKKKLEKKCNKHGVIIEVYDIINYSDGIMPPEYLNGGVIYNISYSCKMCIIQPMMTIAATVKIVKKELIICESGPIMIFIPNENVDENKWDNTTNEFIHEESKNVLQINNLVAVLILDYRINQNDAPIKSVGKLLDFI